MNRNKTLKLLAILVVDALLVHISPGDNNFDAIQTDSRPKAVSVHFHKAGDGSYEEHDFVRNLFRTENGDEFFCSVCGFSFTSGVDEKELDSIAKEYFSRKTETKQLNENTSLVSLLLNLLFNTNEND